MGWPVGARGGLRSALLLALLDGCSARRIARRRAVAGGDAARQTATPPWWPTSMVTGRTSSSGSSATERSGTWSRRGRHDDEAWTLRDRVPIPELTRSAGDRRIAPGSGCQRPAGVARRRTGSVLVWARVGRRGRRSGRVPVLRYVSELIWQGGGDTPGAACARWGDRRFGPGARRRRRRHGRAGAHCLWTSTGQRGGDRGAALGRCGLPIDPPDDRGQLTGDLGGQTPTGDVG